MKILDCTLRDGGYYNKWAFSPKVIDRYLSQINELPVSFVELGYRTLLTNDSYGQLYNVPVEVMAKAAMKMPNVERVIMIDEKNTPITGINKLLNPCLPYVSMIRIAVSLPNLRNGMLLAKEIKEMGFKTCMNLLYASEWKNNISFTDDLVEADDFVDYLYIVDSFGSMEPANVAALVKSLKRHITLPLGFHGHNNMELALMNAIVAYESGCDLIDSTVQGMGRGSGNLKTELLLTYLSKKLDLPIHYDLLASLVENFEPLLNEYKWGTNLAYMFSGRNSIHQNEVMSEMTNKRVSLKKIIQHLLAVHSLSATDQLMRAAN